MYYIVHTCMYLWLELTLRSSLSPTRQVGVKAMDRNKVSGYQNQNWVKTSIPTTPSMFMWPVRDCNEIVMLRPPEREKKGHPLTRSFNNLMKIAYVMIFGKHILNISIFNKYFMWEVNILWNSCVYYALLSRLLWQTLALASPINLCILETMFRSKSMKIDDNQNQWNNYMLYLGHSIGWSDLYVQWYLYE